MFQIGEFNKVFAEKYIGAGMLLKDPNSPDVALLPAREVPQDLQKGMDLEAFIYQDRENRFVATLTQPNITLYKFGYLKVKEVNETGAFLDWGIQKDLMVPFARQSKKMVLGLSYIVYLDLDKVTNRLIASSKYHKYLIREGVDLEINQEVDLIVTDRNEIGYKVIVNDLYSGMLFKNEVYQLLRVGQRLPGYVKQVRPDGKVDVVLQQQGYQSIEPNADKLREAIKKRGGFLPLTDKSSPDEIKKLMGMSKKTFKKAVGALYKRKIIRIDEMGLFLTEE